MLFFSQIIVASSLWKGSFRPSYLRVRRQHGRDRPVAAVVDARGPDLRHELLEVDRRAVFRIAPVAARQRLARALAPDRLERGALLLGVRYHDEKREGESVR